MSRMRVPITLCSVLVALSACAEPTPTSAVVTSSAAPGALMFDRGHGAPIHEFSPSSHLDFPAGTVCTFELLGEPVSNNGTATIFPPAANGDVEVQITGTYVERLINAGTGRSITENLSGPLLITSHADGSATLVLRGRTQLFFFPTDLPAGPRAYINSGRAELAIAPDGQEVLVSQSGTQEDICAALQ